mmetsp:Transcript_17306/g.35664  ORF Transcript_17306/g.35664 Transcript_17306/m.35664 type:complete len:298 (-) Transcript_17306:2182-3075(-)
MDISRHVVGLQSLPMNSDEVLSALGPLGEDNVVDDFIRLRLSQIQSVAVLQELRHEEEFGNQLLHVALVAETRLVGRRYGLEESVRLVELSALQLKVQRGERFYPHQVPDDKARSRKVSTVVERRNIPNVLSFVRVVYASQALISLIELHPLLFHLGAHGPPEIPVICGILKVDRFRIIITQNPGKDWVLRQVTERPPRNLIQSKEVVESADIPVHPRLGDNFLVEGGLGLLQDLHGLHSQIGPQQRWLANVSNYPVKFLARLRTFEGKDAGSIVREGKLQRQWLLLIPSKSHHQEF